MSDIKPLEDGKFERIREIYVESFPEKIQSLRNCWAVLNEATILNEPLAEFRTEVHKIAGSSGSHEFNEIHMLAKNVESKLLGVIEAKADWDANKDDIGNFVQQLVDLLETTMLNYNFSEDEQDHIPRLDALQLSHRELVNFKPDLILIACDSTDDYWKDSARIVRLHETHFNMPIVFLIHDENKNAKLNALNAGADDCIYEHELQEEQFQILKQRILRFRRANHLIIMDYLTGALNRDAFMEHANEEISLAIRRKESICLAMIDVDHFKQINDENGHVVGDYVLRHISDYLNNRLRRSDVVGRYAGDEFLVLLPDTDLDSAYLVLDMVRKNLVAHNIKVNNADVRISISLGLIAARRTEPLDIETLIVEADKKMYEAKVAGRNMLVAGVAKV